MNPKPITLTAVATEDYEGAQTPQPFVAVGDFNGLITPADFVAVDATPADAAAVAADLEAIRDALIAAGLMAES